MRDYSDAPAWATEAFNTGLDNSDWYYGNKHQYTTRGLMKKGVRPLKHTDTSLAIISGPGWWREPLNFIQENE